jgi:exosortase
MAEPRPSLLDDTRRIAAEVRTGWSAQPDKLLFGLLLLAWLALFHFLGNAVFGYIDTPSLFSWCHQIYQAPDEEHCLYVPLVVLGLLIWKRHELIALPKRHWWPGAIIVALGLLLHLGGYLVQQTRLSLIGCLIGLYGLTGWIWGPAWLRATFFPMFLLGFCVPISAYAEVITSPLRILVTKVSVGIGHELLGIGVYRQGSMILNAQGVAMYDVAPACSGIRSLISLIALATVFAFVSYQSWWRRAVLIGAALPLAVLGNILRITTVIIVGEAFGQPAGAMIEQKFGFLTFGIAMVGLFALAHWMREQRSPTPPAPPAPPHGAVA